MSTPLVTPPENSRSEYFPSEGGQHQLDHNNANSNGNGDEIEVENDKKDKITPVDTSVQQVPAENASYRSPSSDAREKATRLNDDLALLEAVREVASVHEADHDGSSRGGSGRSRRAASTFSKARANKNVDEFDEVTNPLHEKAAAFNLPENPTTEFAKFIKKLHNSSFIIRYISYITPVVVLLLIPLLVGALKFKNSNVGGVRLLWFSVWLEIFWLTLWAGRVRHITHIHIYISLSIYTNYMQVVAKCLPSVISVLASVFTNNAKKWRDMAKQLELPATLFFWWLGVEISFLPTMVNHHVDNSGTRGWERTVNKIIVTFFVWTILNFLEKILIQLIAMNFHKRTYSDRIEVNKFQIGSLTKLYIYSAATLSETDDTLNGDSPKGSGSGTKTPLQYAGKASKMAKGALNRVGNAAGAAVADFTGRKAAKSDHPYQIVLSLLRTPSGSQALARRLYRTYVREGNDVILAEDLKVAFDNDDEAEAAFLMFDKDLNGDISMEELEAVCVEVGRERKAITASLKDLDSVVSKLDHVMDVLVFIIVILVLISLISTSASGVLTSAGSFILGLSWLFSTTAQEFLQSIVFVFIKHPFDVGDRVTIYGNSGDAGLGDDYFVKQISLLYTEFKKMQGHIVQAPNSYLNTLFILNQRRSGALAEAVPIKIKFGTTLDQIEGLRLRLVEYARSENREFQSTVLTELREVTENFSITLNIVFFYKSNWQNEGLRLQRRNKFICMLMVALMEIGIEGPRMNLQGAAVDIPFHVTYGGATASGTRPGYGGGGDNNNNDLSSPMSPTTPVIPEDPQEGAATAGGAGAAATNGRHPSILRKGINVATARARGDSTASRRHVGFSLGMDNVSAADVMGDVFEDRGGQNRADEVVIAANRDADEQRRLRREEREREYDQGRSTSMSTSRSQTRQSGDNNNGNNPRPSTSGSNRSVSLRNAAGRFRRSRSREQLDLAEQGESEKA